MAHAWSFRNGPDKAAIAVMLPHIHTSHIRTTMKREECSTPRRVDLEHLRPLLLGPSMTKEWKRVLVGGR